MFYLREQHMLQSTDESDRSRKEEPEGGSREPNFHIHKLSPPPFSLPAPPPLMPPISHLYSSYNQQQ